MFFPITFYCYKLMIHTRYKLYLTQFRMWFFLTMTVLYSERSDECIEFTLMWIFHYFFKGSKVKVSQ